MTRRIKLYSTACDAIYNMYHSATPTVPDCQNDYEYDIFWNWFYDEASFEIDHIQGGGAHGGERTLKYVVSQYKSNKAQALARKYYKAKVAIERDRYARHENIINYGKLYVYGRGGRTVAIDGLITSRCGHFQGPNEDILDAATKAELTEIIKTVQAFNVYVKAWNDSVPDMWAEYKQENDLQDDIDAMDGKTAKIITKTVYV